MPASRRAAALLLAVVSSACSLGGGRSDTLAAVPSFRARTIAVAAVRGSRGKGVDISRALTRRLEAEGIAAASLEESDSVLAGAALGLDTAANPRVLDEIRRATGADAIAFLSLDPSWRSLDVSALDARTGEAVLRTAAHPRGDEFASPAEVAEAAARALSALAAEHAKPRASAPPGEPVDEIPVP